MDSYQISSNQLQATSAIDQAIEFLTTTSVKPPASKTVVEGLLQAEKVTKQTKVHYTYQQLLGTWRLGFVTGTKRSRQRAGVILGAGRFLPRWVKIQLSYYPSASSQERGTTQNSVEFGSLQLILTGPVQFWPKQNLLSFDFTQVKVSLFGIQLYKGYIRGGQDRETQFWNQSLKEQAFFTYFLVQDNGIAARGRGGGLALWTKAGDINS